MGCQSSDTVISVRGGDVMRIDSSGKPGTQSQNTQEPRNDSVTINPWNKEALENVAEAAVEVTRTSEMVMSSLMDDQPFIGSSSAVKRIFEIVDKVANTDSTVLILGESGTGKELIARALHTRSNRRSKPFIPVNCGAIPSELLETELFGHVKGSFTGAHSSRMGRFTLAHQGTLFLDEIGTMPASLQVKILRALQNKEFEQVGGTKTIKSDCRVIAATNDDLEAEVSKGNFREDLFYRLNVIPIHLPPLRERREDIKLLVEHFVKLFNAKKGYAIDGVSSDAMDVLIRYNWPGNVRELENIVQRVCILKGEGRIETSDLPPKLSNVQPVGTHGRPWASMLAGPIPESGIPFDELVSQFENDLISKALEQTKWNKNRAAQLLQLNRTTLVEKIKKRGLAPSSD